MESCREQAKSLGVSQMVDFLGYRKDIQQLVPMCDIAVASSLREGLPVNIMEAMACGLPVVAIDNRGHKELVHNNKNGWVVSNNNPVEFSNKIKALAGIESLRLKFGINGRRIILKRYSINKVLSEKSRIYQAYMEGTEGAKWAIQ
jgi:glycosyltransferase EpsD